MSGAARATVVLNPVAGPARRRADRVALARRLLAESGVGGEVRVTEGRGHAFALARAAVERGADVVCAWGGDGTVNEVARALIGGAAALGVVPAGSGNGLARTLGLPRRAAAALATALHGRERLIDAGEVDGRLFVCLAGLGLDAEVAARFEVGTGSGRGLLRYVRLTLAALLRYRPASYAIRVDGAMLRGPALLVVCANGRQYGNGAVVAPQARPDDGRLDLVVVEPRAVPAALWTARRLFTGTLDRAPGVRSRPFVAAEIQGPAPLAFHVDGEPCVGGPTVVVRVRPGALRVRVR
jgi:diacylglycerol kinase (ATP)